MIRGGSRSSRRLASIAAIATIWVCLYPFGPTANARTPVPRTVDVKAGEDGSGPAPFPIRVPHVRGKGSKITWSDIGPSDAWARPAIKYVGGTRDWMRDFPASPDGSYPFKPGRLETRKYFARAVVKAFAPDQAVDTSIAFTDLQPTQTFYRWANIAVKMGWMRRSDTGGFMPDGPVTMVTVHRVLVLALGMRSTARQLDKLHTRAGYAFNTPVNFGTTMLGMRLGLRSNADAQDNIDVNPNSFMPRTQVAFSLYKATTLESWVVPYVAGQYDGIELPTMGAKREAIVRWGIQYVGYPYIWAGEWGMRSPEPSALGGQKVPGFDCSGLTWWALRADDGGSWNISPPRPYRGWPLPQRSSADMASTGRLKYKQLLPGDLMFYDGDNNGVVDHVDVYVGKGYSLDSSHTPGGVTIMWVGDGWYRDHFVHGRRLLPTT